MSPAKIFHQLAGIVGDQHVLTDPQLTAGYTVDWTGRWQGDALAVVRPGVVDEVAEVVRACAAAGVAVVPQGGNTGLVGGSIPRSDQVLLSLRRLDRVEAVDPVAQTIAAGAGVTVARAQAVAAEHDLRFGIDLASRDSATLGGIVATNAGGVRVVRHGPTRAQLLGIEAVLADGSIVRRWTGLVKDNVGYDLPGLFAGSEGTLGVVTSVLMRLVVPAAGVHALLLALGSLDAALAALAAIRRTGLTIEAAEFMQRDGVELVCQRTGLRPPFPSPAATYLLVEVSGATAESAVEALEAAAEHVEDATVEPAPARRLWAYRESHTEAVNAASSTPPVKLDISVPVSGLAEFEAALRRRLDSALPGATLVAFGHIAEGNLHVNLLDVPLDDAENATDVVLRLVAEHGGSISAEHGVGVAKLPWVRLGRTAADLAAMRAIKRALDPASVFNPGVLLPPA